MGIEKFRFDGKRALVVGGASGMGAATAKLVGELGAKVVVMDYAPVEFPVDKAISLDLRDQASIEAAIDDCGGPIDALFACAGVADGPGGGLALMQVNFIGQRHLIDRAVEAGLMPSGSAIAMISSAAGVGWLTAFDTLVEFLDTPDFETATKWIEANPGRAHYMFSKQAINAYVALQAFPLLKRGIRINATQPGPTDTPLARANADLWLTFASDYREQAGIETATPEEQANLLVFLCSEAASQVNGVSLISDAGYLSSALVDTFEAPMAKMMLGRT